MENNTEDKAPLHNVQDIEGDPQVETRTEEAVETGIEIEPPRVSDVQVDTEVDAEHDTEEAEAVIDEGDDEDGEVHPKDDLNDSDSDRDMEESSSDSEGDELENLQELLTLKEDIPEKTHEFQESNRWIKEVKPFDVEGNSIIVERIPPPTVELDSHQELIKIAFSVSARSEDNLSFPMKPAWVYLIYVRLPVITQFLSLLLPSRIKKPKSLRALS